MAACFADFVGFTRLGEALDAEDLGALVGRLGELAADVAFAPVRLVKMIGDAAMLVSSDTDALLEAALTLVAAADAEGEGFPQLRAGLAHGPAVPRAGDWYGSAGQPGEQDQPRSPVRGASWSARRFATLPPTATGGRSRARDA